ncbi:uncharacterized protein LOC129596438 [Paramacrobiotus metropolitanus]|uniref:uncharacterized protein LOC129596438 n=1 Tax=Paramacrobiotus metropolitanus TaxID=2943436 RepID=UPI002445DE59|nr:uncharacterized protein LOC129596438 [Paramacrobiotus metropolitanus]
MWRLCAVLCVFLIYPHVSCGSSHAHQSRNHLHNRQAVLIPKEEMRDINGLQCPPCAKMFCPRKSRLMCKGGLSLDVCQCCAVCAKVENEQCGGKGNYFGTCDAGLYCSYAASDAATMTTSAGDGDADLAANHGICRKQKSAERAVKDIFGLADEAQRDSGPVKESVCQPKCTPELCTKNPRAICSAIDNADETRPCQTGCQHTSCMACRFTNSDPQACPSCRTDDFHCMKRYGRCIRKQTCWRRKFPCSKAMLQSISGKFQCLIPECPG